MNVKKISANDLCSMENSEGLILQGCGGSLDEWVDGINDLLTDKGILLGGARFTDVSSFEHNGVACLLFPFSEDVKLDVGKLATWRLLTYEAFGGTWLSDYVLNQLGGFTARQGQEVTSQPDCPLTGENGNITSAGDLATDGNDEEEMTMY